MNFDRKGGLPPYARTQPKPQPHHPTERKAGEMRVVEVNGRRVKLMTVARPAAVPRPVGPKPLPPAALPVQLQRPSLPQVQPQPPVTPAAPGIQQVKVQVAGVDPLDDLLSRHLDHQAQGTAPCSFTEAILDVAAFHDKRDGWSLFLSPGVAVQAWPPTPEFMGRVFTHVLKAGGTEESKGKAVADTGLARRLFQELLQALLVPARLLRLVEQLRAVAPDDPKHPQAQATQRKVLADHGRYELPQSVDRMVHALMLQSRGTPHKDAIDRALVAMLATASQRLTPESFRRLAFTVQAGMKGEALAAQAGGKPEPGK